MQIAALAPDGRKAVETAYLAVLTRRPTAAPCWRLVRVRRSTHAVVLGHPPAADTG